MSNNKMLIDATHPEETRVVVLRENRVEEFDYESAARKLLRGSIYLAKITRVEPSLQAAFVDYGGNRHGFLAFSEIHPDYYQIPHADRQALLEEELAEQRRLKEADDAEDGDDEPVARATEDRDDDADDDDFAGDDAAEDANASDEARAEAHSAGDDTDADLTDAIEANALDVTAYLPPEEAAPAADAGADTDAEPDKPDAIALEADTDDVRRAFPPVAVEEAHVHITTRPATEAEAVDATEAAYTGEEADEADEADEDDDVESINADVDDEEDVQAVRAADNDDDDDDDEVSDDAEEADGNAPRANKRARPRRRARQYKIQEVVKRRQIVLIQVVKEERGNKGAALTTYLSLAGRYTVLMPNTARGGGISRKITNVQDRKRLKAIAQELDVPEGMGLIIRTAGAARTKQEIKRDFEYLLRLWENVRSLTLESTAPSLVYEEGNLIKRSIRDLYTKDIDEIVVAGEHAFKEAKGFMKMLMPSHAKNVLLHTDHQSLFARYRIEQQLNAMFSPVVQLRSGGYLVINQTEALVAVDVNSGKSTREFSIEETALNTNLEAAEELSRQLKLRDLAGLIVVDFIDMDEKRNNRAVERRLKDCLKADRARIQIGRISHFGLLEMSRQRLRTGVLEGSTMPCTHCQGSGIVRSTESVSLAVLRGLEDNFLAGKVRSCVALCSADVALYLLNQKRAFIQDLEQRYGVVIHVRSSDKHHGANFAIEWLSEDVELLLPASRDAVNIDAGFEPRKADNDDQTEDDAEQPRSRRRRRRGGRRDEARKTERRRDDDAEEEFELADTEAAETREARDTADGEAEQSDEDGERRSRRSRRRGRRGGRRHREQRGDAALAGVAVPGADQPDLSREADDEAADHDGAAVETGTESAAETSLMARLERLDEPPPSSARYRDADTTADDRATEAEAPTAAEAGPVAQEAHAPEPVETAEPPIEAPPAAAEPVAEALIDADVAEPAAAAETEAVPEPPADDDAKPVAAEAQADAETIAETPEEPKTAVAEDEGAHPAAVEDDRAARSQPVAGEPVIQHVIVGPNGAQPSTRVENADAEPSDEPAKPTRRGWWQRQFGV